MKEKLLSGETVENVSKIFRILMGVTDCHSAKAKSEVMTFWQAVSVRLPVMATILFSGSRFLKVH